MLLAAIALTEIKLQGLLFERWLRTITFVPIGECIFVSGSKGALVLEVVSMVSGTLSSCFVAFDPTDLVPHTDTGGLECSHHPFILCMELYLGFLRALSHVFSLRYV